MKQQKRVKACKFKSNFRLVHPSVAFLGKFFDYMQNKPFQ